MKQHSQRFLSLVSEAKKQIKEITVDTLKEKLDRNEPIQIIDVREDSEWESGSIPNALHLSKGVIERDIEKIIPNPNQSIVVFCSGGFRCALVAESLQKMGYTEVSSLDVGLKGWIDAGYPIEKHK